MLRLSRLTYIPLTPNRLHLLLTLTCRPVTGHPALAIVEVNSSVIDLEMIESGLFCALLAFASSALINSSHLISKL